MIFQSLNIYRRYGGINAGTIKFENEDAIIELKIDDACCKEMLRLCANQLVEASKDVANSLTSKIIDVTAKLEPPANSDESGL